MAFWNNTFQETATKIVNEDTTWKVESDPRSEDRKVLDQKRPTGE